MTTPDNLPEWRKQLRAQLLERRLAVPAAKRRQWSNAIAEFLAQGFAALSLSSVGCYWPYRGEFDPRPTMRLLRRCGVKVALPVVLGKAKPLEYREWWPGAAMSQGALNLPFPTDTQVLTPDVLLIPLLGFDQSGFRLGYGGGYFDRTLAAMRPQPLKLGVGFDLSGVASIHPQWHDIAMDFVITESGVRRTETNGLVSIEPSDAVSGMTEAAIEQGRGDLRAETRPYLAEGSQYSSPPCFAHEFAWYDSIEPEEREK